MPRHHGVQLSLQGVRLLSAPAERIAGLMSANHRYRPRIRRVLHPRAVWLETLLRIQRLEDRQEETERLLDQVFSDAVYQHGDAAFNGQRVRKALVKDLFDRFRFAMVVESGTHFGTTTGYLAREYDVPVHTSE